MPAAGAGLSSNSPSDPERADQTTREQDFRAISEGGRFSVLGNGPAEPEAARGKHGGGRMGLLGLLASVVPGGSDPGGPPLHKIPQETPTVTVELLPPIEPPLERIEPRPQPAAPAPVRLRPIQTEKPATVVAAKPVLTRPLTLQPPPIVTPPTPAPPVPPSPSEAPRQNRAVQFKPVEVQRPPAPVTAVTTLNKPLEIQAPPTLAPPVQAPATPATAPPRPVSVQAQPEVVPRAGRAPARSDQ